MSSQPARTLTLRDRDTGEDVKTFDTSGMSDRTYDRFWMGLCRKVDFAKYRPLDSADPDDAAALGEGGAR